MKRYTILSLKTIIVFISIIITWVQADNIRIPGFSWEQIDVVSNKGDDLPEGRRDYAIGYINDNNEVIIYGGRTSDDRVLSDTWIFNLNTGSWRKPLLVPNESATHPPGRYGMVYGNDQPASNSYRNTFVVTGGKGSDGKIYNDLWSFDVIRECWVELKAKGDIPEPRYDAIGGINLTLLSYLNQLSTVYLILSHGRNDSKHFSDTYILKLDGRSQQGDYSRLTAEWKKLNTKNAPALKDGATGNVLSSDRLVVYGGCENVNNKSECDGKGYFLDINFNNARSEVEGEAVWQEVSNDCVRPKAYAAATRGSDQSEVDLVENDRLIIFGGYTQAKYGSDADGDITIFDMDKKKFFGVHPSSKSNDKYPKASKGVKMVTTYPKGDGDSFSIIVFGGEPLGKDESWSTDIWKLNVSKNYNYYPTPPDGVTMTDCYTIIDIKEEDHEFDDVKTTNDTKETIPTFILFILGFMVGIPALVLSSRAMNCFTFKWKIIFFSIGGVSFLLVFLNLILNSGPKNGSVIILKIIIACILLIYLILPFLRPKQPNIDFNQIEVNAAGIPIVSSKEKAKPEDHHDGKEFKGNSSSTTLLTKDKGNATTAAVTDNGDYNSNPKLAIDIDYDKDSNYSNNTNSNSNSNSNNKKKGPFVSPIYINPRVKEAGKDDDDDDSYISEIEDEDEVIKKKFLSRAKQWVTILRGIGMALLIGTVVLVFLLAFKSESRFSHSKIVVFIWVALLILLYIGAIIIARMKHSSMALLKARRISFRRSDPLDPNPLPTSWAMPMTLPVPGEILSESASASGNVSAYDDIGNVSGYSNNFRINNNMSSNYNSHNNSIIISNNNNNSNSNTSTSTPSQPVMASASPLPVNNVYLNNQGLFSVQPNFTSYSPSQTPTISTSLVNQPEHPAAVYRPIMNEIVPPEPSFSSSTDPLVPPTLTTHTHTPAIINGVDPGQPKIISSSSHGSLPSLIQEQSLMAISQQGSSPLLEESTTIPIDLEGEAGRGQGQGRGRGESTGSASASGVVIIDDTSRDLAESMNDKEGMMVMTVPKRKLAVVNM